MSFPQIVTAIARIAEEIVLKDNLVATMSERLHYLCQHLETVVESKKNWGKLQNFTKRLGMTSKLLKGMKHVHIKGGQRRKSSTRGGSDGQARNEGKMTDGKHHKHHHHHHHHHSHSNSKK